MEYFTLSSAFVGGPVAGPAGVRDREVAEFLKHEPAVTCC